jgi:hypothetical protein
MLFGELVNGGIANITVVDDKLEISCEVFSPVVLPMPEKNSPTLETV